MGGDFLHIALDVSGDGKLPVPPRNIADPLTQVFNFTLFLTSTVTQKNFTISNLTTSTPPFADILDQESGQTVKHINFEWPECLVGDNNEDEGSTARGDYNISIHQNYRLNGVERYTIFNLPISVTNSIQRFPGASQLTTKPAPGPLSANGGRMPCAIIENPLEDFQTQVNSVNNPPGQPMQDIPLETSARSDGGQVGGNGPDDGSSGRGGNGNNQNGQGEIAGQGGNAALGGAVKMTGESFSILMIGMLGAVVVMCTSVSCPKECGHPRAAFRRRSDAAGPGECPPCLLGIRGETAGAKSGYVPWILDLTLSMVSELSTSRVMVLPVTANLLAAMSCAMIAMAMANWEATDATMAAHRL
ncbi:hypothetical protein IG631_04865 [Alternaria alternata]|nr:hypothetical protein IG631_04865 [Alternaria alternata]